MIAEDTTGCGTIEDRKARGPYQQLHSGKPFYLLDPRPDEIDLGDIAESLSKQCRYMGHCTTFYSVAQHSVMVSEILQTIGRHHPHGDNQKLLLWGLLHDAAEAYVGDVTRPMKIALNEVAPGKLQDINERIEKCIAARFGLDWQWVQSVHGLIKKADNIALVTEKRDLMVDTGACDWGTLPDPMPYHIAPLPPRTARIEFLLRYHDIIGDNDTLPRIQFSAF